MQTMRPPKKPIVIQTQAQRKHKLTILGDSTIDNKVWVAPGLPGNFLATLLGIKREDSKSRIRRAQTGWFKPELSVVEHLTAKLPNFEIKDYSNDGFTTKDVLNGAHRDKVFGEGKFAMFPHEELHPIEAAEEDIKDSDYVLLSIGGNNFREFLQRALIKDGEKRKAYIKENYNKVFTDLKKEYIEIVNRIRKINPNATLVLMTQYYPSFKQNKYNIYKFMSELGQVMGIGENHSDPMDVIHEVVKKTYSEAFKEIDTKNIIVADITSSLDPFNKKNHTWQIEPSGVGGEKIAEMLKKVLVDKYSGIVYRFQPNQDPEAVSISSWVPNHPLDFKNSQAHDLLSKIYAKRNDYNVSDPMYGACINVYDTAKELLLDLKNPKDIASLNKSLTLAYNVLCEPKNIDRVLALKANANNNALGKPSIWKKFLGALSILVGVALCGVGIANTLETGGLSLASLPLGGSLISAGGAALFYSGRQKSLAKRLDDLAEASYKTAPKLA